MGTNSSIEVKPADANSMIVSSVPITSIVDLDTTSRNKTIEVKVYRKWVSTSVRDRTPVMCCYILIDREGTIENITIRRAIEIEILNGNRVELMMWSKMATWFDIKYFEAIEKPVFIFVSSYRVSDYIGIMWHSSTVLSVPSAGGNRLVYANGTGLPSRFYAVLGTGQYFPKIWYEERCNLRQPMAVERQGFDDREREQMRNKVTGATM
ncbi:hypothetical protein Tco_1575743 [Tanacetum coccineum]